MTKQVIPTKEYCQADTKANATKINLPTDLEQVQKLSTTTLLPESKTVDLPLTPKSRFDGTNLVLTDSTPATLDVLQAELVELRSYCSFYARLYNELNLDMLQVKHILKRTTSATGDPPKAFDDYIPGKFTNTANGLSLHKQQDTSPKVQELLEQIKKLEIENNELKLKLSFAESANGMGSKNSSRGSSLGSENAFVVNGEEKSKVC